MGDATVDGSVKFVPVLGEALGQILDECEYLILVDGDHGS
jgi:hypothetical protein